MPEGSARFLREFVSEGETLLAQAEEHLAALSEGSEDPAPQTLNALFRAVHSLKGVAGMVGLPAFADAAHAFESLLDAVRRGQLPFDLVVANATRKSVEALRKSVAEVAKKGCDSAFPPAYFALIEKARVPRVTVVRPEPEVSLPPDLAAVISEYERTRLVDSARKGKTIVVLPLEFTFDGFDEGLRKAMGQASAMGELIGTFPGASASPDGLSFQLLVAIPEAVSARELARSAAAAAFHVLEVSFPAPVPGAPEEPVLVEAPPEVVDPAPTTAFAPETTVRVDLEKISHLLDLAASLAVARAELRRALLPIVPRVDDRAALREVQRAMAGLDAISGALSRAALATRLVPVDFLALRLSRAVKQLAKSLGKEAELFIFGAETELDKVLADQLADPLMHMVRNALDHGIELPEEREAKGKPRAGRLELRAETRGRDVLLALSDDGRGVDAERVLARARERGLVAEGENPKAEEILFLPGFSTADAVSEISGRGVGLDVVRENIRALEGTVVLTSTPGAGTTFTITVPMTLALVESLLVTAGGRSFAIPASAVERTLPADQERYEMVRGRVSLRDEAGLMPVVRLETLLGLPSTGNLRAGVLVVAQQGPARAALVVEEVLGLSDLIVKPLPDDIPRAREVTGTAEREGGGLTLALDAGLLVLRASEGES